MQSPYPDTDFTYVQTEHIINHLHIRKSRYAPPLYPRERHTLLIVQESWEGPGPVWPSTEYWDPKLWNMKLQPLSQSAQRLRYSGRHLQPSIPLL